MRFPGKIPVTIHPVFWLLAGLIGWFNSGSLIGIVVWAFVILISVLVHEFGHALLAFIFHKKPRIELIAVGGATIYDPRGLKFWQEFLIVFAGPFFGLALFFIAYLLLAAQIFTNPLILEVLAIFKWVNLVWSILNLIPVLPLDGGQLLRIVLESFFGVKGYKVALFVGMAIALAISFFFFLVHYFLIGALFFLFAFQSFEIWRRSRLLSASDRQDAFHQKLQEGEKALQLGQKQDAKRIFSELCQETKNGMLFVSATYYLALLNYQEKNKQEAYQLLLSVQRDLQEEALCLLQELAFEEKDYPLVAQLSAICYKTNPTELIALRNARAFAFLNEAKPAGGWLQTAIDFGNLKLEEVLGENFFERVKQDPLFKDFFHKKMP